MSNKAARQQRRDGRRQQGNVVDLLPGNGRRASKRKAVYQEEPPAVVRMDFQPKTQAQAEYANLIRTHDVVFGTGSAGCGKTHVPTALGSIGLIEGSVKRILITRPILEAKGGGEGLGFLKGTEDEKTAPYLAPVRECMAKYISQTHIDNLLKLDTVQFMPLELMRGHTFDDAYIIIDEAQNITKEQMMLVLTRMGKRSKIIISGDTGQLDLSSDYVSGLADALRRFGHIKGIGHYHFTKDDIVRHGMVRTFIEGYERDIDS